MGGHTLLGKIIGPVMGVFGMGARDETIVDVQAINLVSPGIADKEARRASIRESKGDLIKYSNSYKAFQRNYRKKYSKRFIEHLGYSPTVLGNTSVLDPVETLIYLQTIDALAVEIEQLHIKYIDEEEAAWDWMEDNIGWSNENQWAIDDGKKWIDLVITNDTVDIQMDFTREPIETIVDDLTTNYAYDDIAETVEIESELYDVPILDGTDLGGYYRTTVTLQVSPFTPVNIDTTVETANWNIPLSTIDNQKLFLRYNRGGTEQYYYIEDIDTVPSELYTLVPIDMTAILPLKEDNIIVDPGSKMERMLRKLGMEHSLFTTSLDNTDIDSLYIMTAISPNTQTAGGMKCIFNTFDMMLPGSGNVSVTMSKLNMTYSFTMVKNTVNENIMPVGTYTNTLVSGMKTIRWQATETQYKELIITFYTQTYKISGQTVSVGLHDSPDISRFIIPLDVLNRLPYRAFVEVYEESLMMLAYSTEVVHYEWYESPMFSIVLQIVAIVLVIVAIFFPPTWALVAAYDAAVLTGVAITATTMYAGAALVMLAVGVLAGMAIAAALGYMVDQLGLDPALAGIIMMAAAYTVSKGTNISVGKEQWLSLANTIVDSTTQEYQEMATDIMEASAEYIEEMREKNELIIEKLQAFDKGSIINMFDMNAINAPSPIRLAEAFVEQKQNIFGFDHLYAITPQIERRIQVPEITS